jgi:RHS repeat-associated protein
VWRNLQQNRQHTRTRYSSFFIHHSSLSFTFSAKERDSETGLSVTSLRSVSSSSLSQYQTSLAWHSLIRRFGSRYYSSDLSIWLSVDPMSDKYPSLSPYTYCADNPVKLVDPNGEEVFDDIVIHGKNKSSITIKTSLIDLDLNANVDFGGNYTLSSENVALGFQTEFVATGQAGIGTSYGGFKSKIMFFGGDYSGYWYDYIGGDMQVLCGASVEASVGIQTSLVLGIYTGKAGGNTPKSFAGAYTGLSCSAGLKATLCGINLNASSSKALNDKWDVFTFGVSFTQGYQGGIGLSIGSEFGSAKLITKQIPTKDRTIRDRIKNIISH